MENARPLRFVVDASVWVCYFDHREAAHAVSRRFIDQADRRKITLYQPNILFGEVAGAVSRRRNNPRKAKRYTTRVIRASTAVVVPLDRRLSRRTAVVAANHRLKGADAVYAAVARELKVPLVSLDREHLTRLGPKIFAVTPAQALLMLP